MVNATLIQIKTYTRCD